MAQMERGPRPYRERSDEDKGGHAAGQCFAAKYAAFAPTRRSGSITKILECLLNLLLSEAK